MRKQFIRGNLVIEGKDYIVKGSLDVEGTIIIRDGNLVVGGDLISHSTKPISISNGNIYAKSLATLSNINISSVYKNGSICTFNDLICSTIYANSHDIIVGGNANVSNVFCRNYLVDGDNHSLNIFASESTYILGYSNNHGITSPDVFLCEGAYFNGACIIADNFEFTPGKHIIYCYRRYKYSSLIK